MFALKYRDVDRDWRQSKFGMGTKAEEAVGARKNLHNYGLSGVQTQGGTTKDLARRNAHDQWQYSDTITSAYADHPIVQASLWRNVCGYSYNPLPHGVLVDLLVEELETFQGTKTPYYLLDVFEGMNALAPMEDMAEVIEDANQIIQGKYGQDAVLARARGTLCIDDKRDANGEPILDIEELVAHAGKLLDLGYEGIYLKSASGRVDPEFMGQLADRIFEVHGSRMVIEMGVHIHDTYGEALPSMVKIVEAAAKYDMPVELDGLPPAASGWVSHPDYVLLNRILQAHSTSAIAEAAKQAELNHEAVAADEDAIYELTSYYSHKTIRYTPENFEAAYNAAVPGGASATLRGIPGLEDNLRAMLGTDDWDQIQKAVFEMAAEISSDLGYPTMVTPYANIMLVQAACCILGEKGQNNKWALMNQDTIDFLMGRLGEEPSLANPSVVEIAAEKDKTPEKGRGYVRAKGIPDPRPQAREMLIGAGIEDPTRQQILSVVMAKEGLQSGVEYVVSVHNKTNRPVNNRKRLFEASNDNGASPNGSLTNGFAEQSGGNGIDKNSRPRAAVESMGGYAALEKVAQSALMLKLMDDGHRSFPEYAGNVYHLERDRLLRDVFDFMKEHDLFKDGHDVKKRVFMEFLSSKGNDIHSHVSRAIQESDLRLEAVASEPVVVATAESFAAPAVTAQS